MGDGHHTVVSGRGVVGVYVEAGSAFGWEWIAGPGSLPVVGIDEFGASAPA